MTYCLPAAKLRTLLSLNQKAKFMYSYNRTGFESESDRRFTGSSENRTSYIGRYPYEQRCACQSEEFKLRGFEKSDRETAKLSMDEKIDRLVQETGGLMLNITGLNCFFFVRDFHDICCKYDKVLPIIHQPSNREPEDGDVFIVMSKNLRLVRLFSYDQMSYKHV